MQENISVGQFILEDKLYPPTLTLVPCSQTILEGGSGGLVSQIGGPEVVMTQRARGHQALERYPVLSTATTAATVCY